METGPVRDLEVAFSQAAYDDLAARLANARLPDKETVDDWDQGVPLAYARDLLDYWRTDYDMGRCQTKLSAHPNHLIAIDGLDIHFLHIRSPVESAPPLLLTHGWPGSVLEFSEVIGPLTDPEAHGGKPEDAFHLVIPSLPGYGLSGKPEAPGWGVEKIAEAWHVLMAALGYDAWFAQGGDWGSAVTATIGMQDRGGCKGIHVNMVFAPPPPEVMQAPTEEEQAGLARLGWYQAKDNGYSTQQATRPQTIGYALADSPVGQMAWIVEKFHGWTDCGHDEDGGDPERAIDRDRLLDNVMLYWLTNSGASSARLYWQSFNNRDAKPVHVPTGASIFPVEIIVPSRRWAESLFQNIVHWNRLEKGGHFAAMEQPVVFVNELRAAFGKMAL